MAPPPQNIVLGKVEPVVVVRAVFKNNQWTIASMTVQHGSPGESIIKDRAVRIESRSADGKPLFSISRPDPRILYEEEPPGFSRKTVLDSGELTFALPYNERFAKLAFVGQSPEAKPLSRSLDVEETVKDAYRRFKKQ